MSDLPGIDVADAAVVECCRRCRGLVSAAVLDSRATVDDMLTSADGRMRVVTRAAARSMRWCDCQEAPDG